MTAHPQPFQELSQTYLNLCKIPQTYLNLAQTLLLLAYLVELKHLPIEGMQIQLKSLQIGLYFS